MIHTEWKKASFYKVVSATLDEYIDERERSPYRGTPYRPDKCGYIGQILDKVAEERSEGEGG